MTSHGRVSLAAAFVIVVAVLACTVPSPAASPAPARSSSSVRASFDAEAARRHLAYLGDVAREGRLTGSPGYLEAATYVADRFRELGLEPAGDRGTYFQRFPSPVVELTGLPELAILGADATTFRLRRDFSELIGGPRGGGAVEARLVFVGGGADHELADVEVGGAAVLISGSGEGDPAGNAMRRGAAAVIFVARDEPGPLIHYSYIPEFAPNAVPTLVVTEPVGDRLVRASRRTVAELRRAIEEQRGRSDPASLSFDTGLRVRVAVPLGAVRQVEGLNVLGLLRPARPPGDDRYVLIGGHLDGIGKDPDGTVYPGANDNASGPAVTIELARALAHSRSELRHPILFVAWAGEEEGLLGSEAFLERSSVTPFRGRNIIGYINLDVVGCCEAMGASAENPSLQAALSSAARKQSITLGVARGSSDHATFARQGIPAAILIWTRTGPIHTPEDTVAAVDTDHLRRIGLVAAQALLDLAAGD